MKMRKLAALAGLALLGAPADAALIEFTYSGLVTGGSATEMFGAASGETVDLTGKSVTGSVLFDSEGLSYRAYPDADNGRFTRPLMFLVTISIDGEQLILDGAYSWINTPSFRDQSDAGLMMSNAIDEFYNLGLWSSYNDGVHLATDAAFGVGIQFPAGSLLDAHDPGFTYDGPVQPGLDFGGGSTAISFWAGHASYGELVDGERGRSTVFDFAVQSASIQAVPEPASWALMIGGFALAGAVLRQRPRVLLREARA